MKKNTIKSIAQFLRIIKEGFKSVFTKKSYNHLDNVSPIMSLLREGDFKKLTVSERIAIKNKIDSDFEKELILIKEQCGEDIKNIDTFLFESNNL